ncbi:MAG: hypothetical protein P8Z79_06270 [Sedimentisphaerales bacterium]
MTRKAQIKGNRLSAQRSTGPKIADGKVGLAQNAVKHGLFAQQNVIPCVKMSDFDNFRTELLGALAPVGGVEAIMVERILSLSWRIKNSLNKAMTELGKLRRVRTTKEENSKVERAITIPMNDNWDEVAAFLGGNMTSAQNKANWDEPSGDLGETPARHKGRMPSPRGPLHKG